MPLFPPNPPPTRREQYERLLGEVLYEVHALITEFGGQRMESLSLPPDDSKIHELIQRLRDEFGPEETP